MQDVILLELALCLYLDEVRAMNVNLAFLSSPDNDNILLVSEFASQFMLNITHRQQPCSGRLCYDGCDVSIVEQFAGEVARVSDRCYSDMVLFCDLFVDEDVVAL